MTQASPREERSDARASPPDMLMAARFEVPSDQLGLRSPEVTTHLRFYPTASAHRLLVWNSQPRREPTLRWLAQHGDFQLRDPPGFDPCVIQLELQGVPMAWQALLDRFPAAEIEVRPDGTALVSLQGARQDLQWFVQHQQELGRTPVIEQIGPEAAEVDDGSLLTPRQHEALVLASTSGYYEVPRQTSLRELAPQMGISAASLSELLRRAEERLAQAYLRTTTSGLEPTTPPSQSFAMPPIGLTGTPPQQATDPELDARVGAEA